MLLSFSLRMAEKLINRYLRLDEEQSQRLIPYHNKTLKIELLPMQFIFFMRVDHDKVRFLRYQAEASDAVVSTTPLSGLLLLQDASRPLMDNMRLTGDLLFVQTFQSVLTHIHIDWEAFLSRYVGDTMAYHLSKQCRKMQNYQKEVKESFVRSASEYLQEELCYFPTRTEIENFYGAVDILRHDVERLGLRIAYLQQSEA